MQWIGLITGLSTFLLIGLFHVLVIKGEYYAGTWLWPLFLAAGAASLLVSLFVENMIVSAVLGVLAFSALWSIPELFQQKKRVEKGWFPANPRKKKD